MRLGMDGGEVMVTKCDLPRAGGVTRLIALAIISNCGGVPNQPYATFTACGK